MADTATNFPPLDLSSLQKTAQYRWWIMRVSVPADEVTELLKGTDIDIFDLVINKAMTVPGDFHSSGAGTFEEWAAGVSYVFEEFVFFTFADAQEIAKQILDIFRKYGTRGGVITVTAHVDDVEGEVVLELKSPASPYYPEVDFEDNLDV